MGHHSEFYTTRRQNVGKHWKRQRFTTHEREALVCEFILGMAGPALSDYSRRSIFYDRFEDKNHVAVETVMRWVSAYRARGLNGIRHPGKKEV